MYEFVDTHVTAILVMVIAAVIALIFLCIFAKLAKIAMGFSILCVVVPIIFTVFWGDGFRYVSKFASLFQPAYQQQIEDAYEYYKKKDAEDPFLNWNAVSPASDASIDVFHDDSTHPSYISTDIESALDIRYSHTADP